MVFLQIQWPEWNTAANAYPQASCQYNNVANSLVTCSVMSRLMTKLSATMSTCTKHLIPRLKNQSPHYLPGKVSHKLYEVSPLAAVVKTSSVVDKEYTLFLRYQADEGTQSRRATDLTKLHP